MLKLTAYKELLALSQLYLLQEHGPHALLTVEPQLIRVLDLKKTIPQSAPKSLPPSAPPQAVRPPLPAPPTPVAKPATAPQEQKTLVLRQEAEKPKPVPEEKTTEKPFFTLQPLGASIPRDFGDLLQTIRQVHPTFSYKEEIPDDREAKAIGRQWDLTSLPADVTLLSFTTVPRQMAFLHNVAKALRFTGKHTVVLQAQQIEEADGWNKIIENPATKLLIASDYGIYTLAKLMSLVKIDTHGRHFVGKIPLFLMADVELYFKQPTLKAALWKSLSEFGLFSEQTI